MDLIDRALKKHSNGLTTQQRIDLINEFGDSGIHGNLGMPFIAYDWEEEEPKGKNVWRLTAPFFFVYALVIIGIVPPPSPLQALLPQVRGCPLAALTLFPT